MTAAMVPARLISCDLPTRIHAKEIDYDLLMQPRTRLSHLAAVPFTLNKLVENSHWYDREEQEAMEDMTKLDEAKRLSILREALGRRKTTCSQSASSDGLLACVVLRLFYF